MGFKLYLMPMSSERWKQITPSQLPWEREALDFMRERLPDLDPYRAWANFEFIAGDGTINEVDPKACPARIFLISTGECVKNIVATAEIIVIEGFLGEKPSTKKL